MALLRFLAWPIALGLVIAAAVLWRLPPSPAEAGLASLSGPQQSLPPFAEERVSYAAAVRRAAPSVVNIYTRKLLNERRHPLLDEPFYRRFFDQSAGPQQQRMASSLGSEVGFRVGPHDLRLGLATVG